MLEVGVGPEMKLICCFECLQSQEQRRSRSVVVVMIGLGTSIYNCSQVCFDSSLARSWLLCWPELCCPAIDNWPSHSSNWIAWTCQLQGPPSPSFNLKILENRIIVADIDGVSSCLYLFCLSVAINFLINNQSLFLHWNSSVDGGKHSQLWNWPDWTRFWETLSTQVWSFPESWALIN